MTVTESAGTVEDAMERLRPEFMAWRARIDPDDEDDAALAARFLAELPETDAALLRAFGDEFVGNLAWDALVDPTGYLRDAALLFRAWDFDPAVVAARRRSGAASSTRRRSPRRRGGPSGSPLADVEVLPGLTHLASLLTQWPVILRRLGTTTG